jgi:hypothetical protein
MKVMQDEIGDVIDSYQQEPLRSYSELVVIDT